MPLVAAAGSALFGSAAATAATIGTAAAVGSSIYGANKQSKAAKDAAATASASADRAAELQAQSEREALAYARENRDYTRGVYAPIAVGSSYVNPMLSLAASGAQRVGRNFGTVSPQQLGMRQTPQGYMPIQQPTQSPAASQGYMPANQPKPPSADPAQFAGRTVTGRASGARWQSDGTQWRPV